MQIPTHCVVGKHFIGIGLVANLLLPPLRGVVRLLIDIGNFIATVAVISTLAKRRLVLCDGHLPAVESGTIINVVRSGIKLQCRSDCVRVAIGTAACHKVRNTLVDFDFVVLNAAFGGFSLGYIRKIVAKPRPFGIRRLALYLYKPFVGAIRRLIVIPKLLAGVLPLGIDFASICHLARIGIGLSKGIVRRARARASVAKTLQQARMGEDRFVLLAGQADLLKLRRHLIGIFSHAESAEERGCRRGPIRVATG